MNRKEAQHLVEDELERIKSNQDSVDYVVLEDETIEKPWGWVFFYQSKAYVEYGDDIEMLAGNAPIIVNRYTGELVHTGTAYDIEHYLQEYDAGFPGGK
jgi:hypothetical protein